MEEKKIVELTNDELEGITGGVSKFVTATEEANIRTGPGKQYPVIGRTVPGHYARYKGRVQIDREGLTWALVEWNDKAGWVCTKYVAKMF